MNTTTLSARQSEKGFTLVELAIVMIIIGLLIGGVLKGQELIANAQVSATASQIKGFEAATTTFRDAYNALPGDMTAVVARLPASCTACLDGNGNGQIGGAATLGVAAAAGEGLQYFMHLNAVDLISGVDGTNGIAWGTGYPAADIGGGLTVGYNAGGGLGLNGTNRAGTYLTVQGAAAIGTPAMTSSEAARIDRKLDDGNATTGSVFGDNCPVVGDLYDESTGVDDCEIYARIQ